jgi:hypothetical protein
MSADNTFFTSVFCERWEVGLNYVGWSVSGLCCKMLSRLKLKLETWLKLQHFKRDKSWFQGPSEWVHERVLGQSESLGEVRLGRSKSLGEVRLGRSESLGEVNLGRSESLGEANPWTKWVLGQSDSLREWVLERVSPWAKQVFSKASHEQSESWASFWTG